ncbi:MAG: LutC/YkgG family protein [Thermodesulfobacteriota bacterium]
MKNAREDMLARLDAALADAPQAPARGVRDRGAATPDPEALVSAFLSGLDAAGVGHDLAATPREAAEALGRFVRTHGVTTAAAWDNAVFLDSLGLDVWGVLGGAGVRVVAPGGERPCPAVAGADLGVTGAFAALAATGTVVVRSGPGMPRSVSIVPPAHLALVPQGLLVSDLGTFLRALSRPLPSALHAVTGASSTGDIEFVYVKGAHGPRAVQVILLAWM